MSGRERFEVRRYHLNLGRSGNAYEDDFVQHLWVAFKDGWQARADIAERREAELRARIGRLESALSWTLGGHCSDASKVLDERPRQSLVSIKAGALREYAQHKRKQATEAMQGAYRDRCNRMASNAEAYADRIEREAKEVEDGHHQR